MAEFVQSDITVVEVGEAVFKSPEDLEKWWDEYCKVPKDDRGNIKESFLWWSPGTEDRKICEWFDKNYPDGLLGLMEKRQIKRFGKDYIDTWTELSKKLKINSIYNASVLTEEDKKRLLREFAEV